MTRLANLLAATSQLIDDDVARAMQQEVGLGTTAASALVSIDHRPGRSIQTLRTALELSHSGTVRLIDRLVDQQLVSRTHTKGRDVQLTLTEDGQRAVDRIHDARLAAVNSLLESITDHQRRELDATLTQILTARTDGEPELRRICRICNLDTCQSATPCPVDLAAQAAARITPRHP